ncbi:uncharacterized mitochondrial protein AtMg00310-like [Lotus japonicus]|uniref:uncharacterized mitochondrial protein AtMg00310-like n=1 Tax=Lotus japonicus TaxID=34305 RepID=UPI0025912808|nr:uncharacterized mitochondrial protein AtMg00310-like [Lotus japonicus]
MAIVKFPSSFCTELNSIVARFWWKGQQKDRGIHWRSWSKLSKPKREGGMGFRNFIDQNTAHLGKQAWRILVNPTSLWATILKVIYFPNTEFSKVVVGRNPSWAWRSIVEGKNFILHHSRWAIGRGDSIRVRGESWIWNGDIIPQATLPSDMRVIELLDPGSSGWDVGKVSTLFSPQVAFRVLQTPVGLTGGIDSLVWPHSNDGCYSIKTGYHLARLEGESSPQGVRSRID